MEGKIFPEIGNRSFISLSILIQDSLENVRKFTPAQVMRFIRLDMNGKFLVLKFANLYLKDFFEF